MSDSPPHVIGDDAAPPHGGPVHVDPHSDLVGGLGWMALGVAILVGSLMMDRLERQDVNPYTVPGLLPGLLGIAMLLLGGLLVGRSWRRGGVRRSPQSPRTDPGELRRIWMVIALCVAFDVALVGHGLPFWLAAWMFVTTAIVVVQHSARQASGEQLRARTLLVPAVIGLGAALAITLVFQEIFLVRLP